MKRTIVLMVTALILSVGAQAQENKTTKKCGSCKVEKKDSCTNTKQCPFCKDLEREKKLAKIKGAARTLPLPLDSVGCDKCKKNAPNKGVQKVMQTM